MRRAENHTMARLAFVLCSACLMVLCGCSAPPKPTEGEVKQARANDPYMRSIDKAHNVADEQSSREDDAALH